MSKTKKTTSTTKPADPAVTAAYNAIIPQAQSLASQPLQLYTGNLVAPLSAAQNQGIAGLQAAQGTAAPYYSQAQKYFNASAAPITPMQYSPSAINTYMNPYIADVVNKTQNEFNLANQEQHANLTGQSAFNGGLTNDRTAVLQAELAKQQAAAQDPILAQLYASGFQGAQGEFNTQQGVGLQAAQANAANAANAGFGIGALGTSAANTGINAANALINAGGLQQQVAQEQLNVPYEQYLQQQAYPYQSLDFLANILGQAAQGTGTSQVSKSSQPFLGLAAGGRSRLLTGGVPVPSSVPDLSMGYIPLTPNQGARGLISPSTSGIGTSGGDNQDPLLKAASDINAGRTLYNAFNFSGGSGISPVDVTGAVTDTGGFLGGPGNSGFLGLGGAGGFFDTVGTGISDAVDGALAFLGLAGGGRARLADGGANDNDDDLDGDTDTYAFADDDTGGAAVPVPPGATINAPSAGLADAAPTPLQNPPAYSDGASVISPGPADTSPTVPASGLAAAAATAHKMLPGDISPEQFHEREPSIWESVVSGLGSMIAHNNIGAGILGGLADYEKQQDLDRHPTVDHTGSTIRVFYPAEKQWVDTGIPTEAALGREETGAYRTADLAQKAALADAALKLKTGEFSLAQYNAYVKALVAERQADPLGTFGKPLNIPPPPGMETLPGPTEGTGATNLGGIGATNRANNNFGNLRTPDGKGWQKFDTPQEGIDAVTNQLSIYGKRDKLNTISGIVSKYAPPTENDTAGYIKDVSTQLGVDPNAPLNMNDPTVLKALTGAIIKHEQGGQNIAAATLAVPAATPTNAAVLATAPPGATPIPAATSSAGGALPVPVPPSVPGTQSADGPHGAAFLATIPPAAAAQVKALAEGRMQFPGGFALKSPYWQAMITAVAQYDPAFDAVNYNARAATRKDFSSPAGKAGQNLISFNTAIGHLGTLDASIAALNNSNFPWVNKALNTIEPAAGNVQQQTALARFNTAKDAVAAELTRAFRGSGGNVHDIENWEATISAADSPAALHAAIQQAVALLHSRIDAVGDQYNRGMGTTADPLQLLSPKAAATIKRLEGGGTQAANAPANTNTAPASPRVGEVRRGFRFKGGDPANPRNWEKAA